MDPADDPKIKATRDRIIREINEWAEENIIGRVPTSEARTVRNIADMFHRRGILVINGRIEGDAVVFDVIQPRGRG